MKPEEIKLVMERLDGLGSGEKALLRRNAATPYERADFRAAGIFLRLLPKDTPIYEEAPLFTALCLRCMWKSPGGGKEFPSAVAALKKEMKDSDTVEKRFLSLLDEPFSADSLFCIKLFRLSHMLCAAGINIDWEKLCADLTKWNHPERYIQRDWMRKYCYVPAEGTAEENDHNE